MFSGTTYTRLVKFMPHLDSEKKETNRAKIKFTQAKKDQDVKELKVNIKPIIRFQAGLEIKKNKVGCVIPMAIVSLSPHADFGPNDHWEDALHFITFAIGHDF